MLSAGLLGGPAIGYEQDSFAIQSLRADDENAYGRYQSEMPERFLAFPEIHGLDNTKVATLNAVSKENPNGGANITEDINNLTKAGRNPADDKNLQALEDLVGYDRRAARRRGQGAGRYAPAFTAVKWR